MKKLNLLYCFFLCFIISQAHLHAQPMFVHDPVMIRQDTTWYLFCTGKGISCFISGDMKNWTQMGPVFEKAPEWAVKRIPGFDGHIWAPDISFYQGKYHLFYSVSAFGKNTSCIGLATNPTLDPKDPSFHWTDQGPILQSIPGRDNWNAIDPNLIVDLQGQPWLIFGSFWSGIKEVKLKNDLSGIAEPQEWHGLASRARALNTPESEAGEGAIEAPFMIHHGKFYYMFVSFDYCCRGVDSNYKIMVGRSENVNGPFVDKEGKMMSQGGGSLFLQGNSTYPGLGHNGICSAAGTDYILFHAYDARDEGRPRLIIRTLTWTADSWPETVL